MTGHDGQRFDRLPTDPDDRVHENQPTSQEVLEFWEERFGVPPESLDGHDFYEKGKGKVWAYAGEADNGIHIESLGLTFLRTRQEHWKPTTSAAQRFGHLATANVIELDEDEARAFADGHDQDLDRWDGDWGYLIATHEMAGRTCPLGVGLYLHGELRSQVPKGRQRDL